MSITAVASAKGGVGKSSFCAGVGNMLASHGKKVLLCDMDIGVRSLDLLLKVAEKTVYNWGDIILGNCERNKAVTEVRSNLSLLAAPLKLCEGYTSDAFKNMIESFRKEYDFIILDSPAGIESGFLLSVKSADMCIVVSTPDPISIRAASFAAENIKENGIEDVRLVVNRFNKKAKNNVCIDDVIDTVSARLLGIVPESEEIGGVANGEKMPYDCKGNLAYLRISERLSGENVKLKMKNL